MVLVARSGIKVFVSYRRDDTQSESRLIYERLCQHFLTPNVFFDIDKIQPGDDWVQQLDDRVAGCSILLAIMGKRWTRPEGSDPDYARLEIEAALARGIPVVPVFVDGGTAPSPEHVVESLRPFLRINGLRVDTGPDFDDHMRRLISHAERLALARREGGVGPSVASHQTRFVDGILGGAVVAKPTRLEFAIPFTVDLFL